MNGIMGRVAWLITFCLLVAFYCTPRMNIIDSQWLSSSDAYLAAYEDDDDDDDDDYDDDDESGEDDDSDDDDDDDDD